MIRKIMKSTIFLRVPSKDATKDDAQIGRDLMDTLEAHAAGCVGMAANMIGEHKRIIAVVDGRKRVLMYNPVILESSGRYETEEGCLSLEGERTAVRYKTIKVSYLDKDFRSRTKQYSGYTAQIIQHEIDHCNGIII